MVFIVPDSQCVRKPTSLKCMKPALEETLPSLAARRGVCLESIASRDVRTPTMASAETELLSPIDFAMAQAGTALNAHDTMAFKASAAAESRLPTKALKAFEGISSGSVCEEAAEPEPLSPIDLAMLQARTALKAYDQPQSLQSMQKQLETKQQGQLAHPSKQWLCETAPGKPRWSRQTTATSTTASDESMWSRQTTVMSAASEEEQDAIDEKGTEIEPLSPIDLAMLQARTALKTYDDRETKMGEGVETTEPEPLSPIDLAMLQARTALKTYDDFARVAKHSLEPDCVRAAVWHCLPAWFGARSEGPHQNCCY